MTFLGPIGGSTFMWIAIGGAALIISAYIIKMRRRRFEVPFAHLWRRVLQEKDANALWKHLKRLLSLLFILAIMGILLFASQDPTLGAVDRDARNVVVLIDASASMKAIDGDAEGKTSRMDAAKQAAVELVESMGGGDLAMIMKVDGLATPLSRFTSDQPMLKKIITGGIYEATSAPGVKAATNAPLGRAITGITASDTPADLPRALAAAADALHGRENPLIVIISDGAFPEAQLGLVSWDPKKPVAVQPVGSGSASATANANKDLATVDLSGIDVRYVPVGKRSDNVGIISFNVRRYIANKAAYEVYIEMQNFGTEEAHRDLALYNGATAVDIKRMDFKPGERKRKIYEKLPATDDNKLRASLRPVADKPGGSDAFVLDDTAYALLPVQTKQKVLMVTEDNLFLEGALLVYDNIDPLKITPAEYDANPLLADKMDVVVFDEHTPTVIPPAPTNLIFFHPTGANSPIEIRTEVNQPHITDLDDGHPVMRWITMSDVFMDKSAAFKIDPKKGEMSLARSINDTIIATKREGRRKMLLVGFSLPSLGRESATDLPMRVAFPMMLVNTLDWFAGDQSDLLTTYTTGRRERVPLDGVSGASDADVKGPDGQIVKTPVIDGLATFYGNRVGYYDLVAKAPDGKVLASIELAANLASPSESDIAPSTTLALGGKALTAPPTFAITHSQKLWTYIILIAAGLILLEWITYHRRITV